MKADLKEQEHSPLLFFVLLLRLVYNMRDKENSKR
jgi:hypothetical protein